MTTGNGKVFLKITNKDIYNKLDSIETLLQKQKTHIKILYSGMGLLFVGLGIILEFILRN